MNIKNRLVRLIENMDFSKKFIVDVHSNKEYSYEAFFRQCYFIALWLEHNCKDSNVVAILDNCVELVQLYFAVAMSSKKIFVIDPQKSINEQQEILNEIEDAFIIRNMCESENGSKIFCDKNNLSYDVIYDGVNDINAKKVLLEMLLDRDFENVYLVTYTSGTTGKSKGVQHSLSNLFGTAYAFWDKVKTPAGLCFLHIMPMTYMAGILNSIFFPFIGRLTIVIEERFSVKLAIRYWNIVNKYSVTVFWMSPAMLTMIEQVDRNVAGIDYCKRNQMYYYIGTAALTEKIRYKFENKYNVRLYASYGLTETLFISVETEASRARGENNVGEILEGTVCQVQTDGELYLDVPWMYMGYTNIDNVQFFDGRYYKTGDLAEVSNGVLQITGRKKDLIIRGGLNISPAKIEKVICQIEGIKECAVFGAMNSRDEEQVCCAYVLEDAKNETGYIESTMAQTVMNTLGKNYRIDAYMSLNMLPRNLNGKVDKKQLVQAMEK